MSSTILARAFLLSSALARAFLLTFGLQLPENGMLFIRSLG